VRLAAQGVRSLAALFTGSAWEAIDKWLYLKGMALLGRQLEVSAIRGTR